MDTDPRLSQGFLVPRIEAVMDILQRHHPPLTFKADDNRQASEAGSWVRGGTSPSGANMNESDSEDVRGANWWIGHKYLESKFGCPQRIVWLPPEHDQEHFLHSDTVGRKLPGTTIGGDAVPGAAGSPHHAFGAALTRIAPCTVNIWGNDFGDTEILLHHIAACIRAENAGAPELLRQQQIMSGGFAELPPKVRGVRYNLRMCFAFPVVSVFDPHGSNEAYSARGVIVRGGPITDAGLPVDTGDLDVTPWRKNKP